jgi:mRNA interferase RelE/StbE
MADVLLHPDVETWLQRQQPDLESRIRSKLADAGDNPDFYLKPLTGRDTHRLRIGDYRAEIEWDKQRDELRVLAIGHRDGFYD